MKKFESQEFFEIMKKIRHEIHEKPELGFEEQSTQALVVKLLKEWGIETHSHIGKTGVVGRIKKGHSKKSIGLRAELDALAVTELNKFSHKSQNQGKMHACGHDGHMAMLLGAAFYLQKYGSFDGTVNFIFQPNEEHGLGALAMIEDKIFDRFPMDSLFAIHNMPQIPVGEFAIRSGPVMASEANFEIVITGKGGHAAIPEKTIDPIVVASQIVLALQSIVSRNVPPKKQAVVSVTDFKTEGVTNVIPGKVFLKGDVRTFDEEVQNLIEERIFSLAKGICSSYGAQCEAFYKRSFIPTVNNQKEVNEAYAAAKKLDPKGNIHTDFSPFMTSEDFGFLLKEKPGCYLFLGNGGQSLHNANYDFNDKNLCLGADFWISLTSSLLN